MGEVVKEGCGMTWDGVCLAVGMPRGEVGGDEKIRGMKEEEWEGLCQDWGFEWVDWEERGRNEYSGTLGPFPTEWRSANMNRNPGS